MKNIPQKIYLQIEDADVTYDKSIDDFNDLIGVSWCEDKINNSDIPYVPESVLRDKEQQLSEAVEVLREMYEFGEWSESTEQRVENILSEHNKTKERE